ncbi:MAG: hypothetical protein U9N82_13195, partial [Thermodesulfobacteriota bacterium]|nr:hypothetical protein [Thermodesulfobacteriota bacterium]
LVLQLSQALEASEKSTMKSKKKKLLTVCLCLLGVSAVVYGMSQGSHPVFITGLILVITGYLLIRKNLKDASKNRS